MEVVDALNPFGNKGFPGVRACLNMEVLARLSCEERVRGSGMSLSAMGVKR